MQSSESEINLKAWSDVSFSYTLVTLPSFKKIVFYNFPTFRYLSLSVFLFVVDFISRL